MKQPDLVARRHRVAYVAVERMEKRAILLVHNAAMAPTPAAEFFGDLVRRAALHQAGQAARSKARLVP